MKENKKTKLHFMVSVKNLAITFEHTIMSADQVPNFSERVSDQILPELFYVHTYEIHGALGKSTQFIFQFLYKEIKFCQMNQGNGQIMKK